MSGSRTGKTGAIRVVLTDDHAMVRETMAATLAHTPDIRVVGQAGDGREACELTRKLRPDVIVMDLEMPGMSGFEAIARIRRGRDDGTPAPQVLVLTAYASDQDVAGAFREGALGYVLKAAPSSELHAAIRIVAEGEAYVKGKVASRLLEFQRSGEGAKGWAFTDRERRVMGMVGDGRTTEEVGRALRVSEKTVKNDVESVCRKLQARNRTHAVRICAERGIIASGGLRQGTALLNGSGALAVERTAR